MNKLHIMVVGLGSWGQQWVEDILTDPNYKIVAIIDKEDDKVEQVISKFKLDKNIGFKDIQEASMIAQPEAALIAVPPAAHFPVAMHCLENKHHILSEKPLANNMEEAQVLEQEYQKQGMQFMVSQDYRWQPPIQTLHNLISNNVIGKIGYITYRHFQSLNIGGWREQMTHVILEDMAIHHFDILRYLTGKDCKEIYAISFNPRWSWYLGGAATSVGLKFEDDLFVNYFATWVTMGPVDSWAGEVRIEGEKGTLSLNAEDEIRLFKNESEQKIDLEPMLATGRLYALKEFYQAISKGICPETSIGDNIKSYAMTRAALASVNFSRPINLEEIFDSQI